TDLLPGMFRRRVAEDAAPVTASTTTGGGSDNNWTTAANWGGTALASFGETAVFAGNNRLSPVMNSSYDVTGLLFGSTAGQFNLTAAEGNTLTLNGPIGNESIHHQTINLPVAINSPQTVDIAAPVTISGPLSGFGELTKAGSSTLTLAGTNNLVANVNITSGTLAVRGGAAISDGATVTLSPSGVLSVDDTETIGTLAGSAGTVILNERLTISGTGGIYTGSIVGTNDLEIAVTGTQAINAATAYTGNTVLTAGTLSINDSSTFGNGAGTLQFNGGTLYRASQTTAQTFTNPVSVTADSRLAGDPVSGTRTINLSGATIAGSGGALTITNTAASGTGVLQVRITHPSANSTAPLVLGQGDFGGVELVLTNTGNGTQVIAGNISGTGKVIKNGTSTSRISTLSGNNSFSGGLDIRGGRINLNTNNAAGSGVINVSSGTIDIVSTVNGVVIPNNIVLAANANPSLYGGTSSSLELAGVISGLDSNSRLTRNNTGSGTVTLAGNNTFAGGVTLLSRTLGVKHRNALGTGTLTIGDPLDTAASTSVTISSLANLTGANAIPNSITVNTNFTVSASSSNPIEFTGNFNIGIPGRGLTKTGTGVLTLSGMNNSYSGATTVSAGALQVNGALTASPVTVASGATLRGSGSITESVTVNGIISPGANAVGTLTTGNQTWNSAGRYRFEMNDAFGGLGIGWDRNAIQGALTINATPENKFVIDVVSLSGTAAGPAANFNHSITQSWTIVTTAAGISGFDSQSFSFVTTSFNNGLAGGKFELALGNAGYDLVLYYIPAPPAPENFITAAAGAGSFTGAANTSYTIQYTDSLNPINWQTLKVVTTDSNGQGSFADEGPLPEQRFYRITYP
ncbi:MAG: beta strand repeat-containing protein, partial [Limisphaerales bacterium]